MSKRGHGEKCSYCKRALESVMSNSRLAATRDHTVPRAHGGRHTVWACRQCNAIKRDMHPEDWEAFMASFPEWWLHPEFRNFGDQPGLRERFSRWQQQARRQNYSDAKAARVSYEESMMIMRHGKDYWRAWKMRGGPICDCCRRQETDEQGRRITYERGLKYIDGAPSVPRCG